MRTRSIVTGIGLAAAIAFAGGPSGAIPSPGAATVGYTAAQAEEGAGIYAERCAICHGNRLEGTYETPGLTGKFIANWGDRPLSDLFDYLGKAMPQFAPGTLTPEEDARIVAFLLRENGLTPGSTPLPANSKALRAMRIGAIPPR